MPRRYTPTFIEPLHGVGAWVPALDIGNDSWARLEGALGRGLLDDERARVTDLLEWHAAFLRDERAGKVSIAQVRATLHELAELCPPDASAALSNADTLTRALVDAAMLGPRRVPDVPAAAADVLRRGVPGKFGRDSPTAFLAGAIVRLWRDLGAMNDSIATKQGYAAPLVHFAAALFDAASAPPCDLPAVAARLRKVRGR